MKFSFDLKWYHGTFLYNSYPNSLLSSDQLQKFVVIELSTLDCDRF